MCELTMVYVPIILPLMLAMGFDSMTAVATALIGSQVGFTLALSRWLSLSESWITAAGTADLLTLNHFLNNE